MAKKKIQIHIIIFPQAPVKIWLEPPFWGVKNGTIDNAYLSQKPRICAKSAWLTHIFSNFIKMNTELQIK